MKIFQHILAINTAKLLSFLSVNLKLGSGTSLPGKFALKISPDILSYLIGQTKNKVIFVTGTNGKTTTAGFIAGILKADGKSITHNRKGANMLTGIATALMNKSDFWGVLNSDYSVLEIDEAYLSLMTEKSRPDILVLTNLFRDQLDRYGELDATANKILDGIKKIKDQPALYVIVNADDPLIYNVSNKLSAKLIYFGIDSVFFNPEKNNYESQKEITTCNCGREFYYSKNFYSHIGHYYCDCGVKRPLADIIVTKAEINVNYSDVSLITSMGSFSFRLNLPGLYNIYNALSAISVAITLGIEPEIIVKGLEEYSTVFGRSEEISIDKKKVLIQLIKNPVGATEVLKTLPDDPDSPLVIGINDNYADGRDVSWLWDAGFDLLATYSNKVICTGIRASDMAVRLKYAGMNIDQVEVMPNIQKAINMALEKTAEGKKLYILPTYTVLLEMQTFLPAMTDS